MIILNEIKNVHGRMRKLIKFIREILIKTLARAKSCKNYNHLTLFYPDQEDFCHRATKMWKRLVNTFIRALGSIEKFIRGCEKNFLLKGEEFFFLVVDKKQWNKNIFLLTKTSSRVFHWKKRKGKNYEGIVRMLGGLPAVGLT